MRRLRFPWIAVACVLLATASCGDDGPTEVDGGPNANTLTILTPPGDAIGLGFGDRSSLRVAYIDGTGSPIVGESVKFSLVTTGDESDGGANLTTDAATTDADGIATVELVAGNSQAQFRVEVSANNAQSQTFYIAVAAGGFTRLLVSPSHVGPRLESAFNRIDIRLYRPSELVCADLNPDDPPLSLFAPRFVLSFGQEATFPNVTSGMPLTAIAWTTTVGSDTRLSIGCVELSAEQLPNSTVLLTLPVTDRALSLPSPTAIDSALDLAELAKEVALRGFEAPWDVLACPAGIGQLVIDCTVDAIDNPGDVDCITDNGDPTAVAIEASRGSLDLAGCRTITGSSLDEEVTDAIVAGGIPDTATWATITAARLDIIGNVTVHSELELHDGSAAHRLQGATVGSSPTLEINLTLSDRPLLAQASIEAVLDPIGAPSADLSVGEHPFTLRLGRILNDAFVALALTPADLDTSAGSLGAALTGAAKTLSNSGCTAVSELVCAAASQAATCAIAGCAAGASFLDDHLEAWWRLVDTTGPDLFWSGTAVLRDSDDDLVFDTVGRDGSGEIDGSWAVTIATTDDPIETITGSFATPPLP